MQLYISNARCSVGGPPAGIWPHVFPASHRLPHLTSLMIEKFWGAEPDFTPPWAWGAADVAALVACCPNLQQIPATCVRLGGHVSALRVLTALTRLTLHYGGEGATPASLDASLQGLAALTQLRWFELSFGIILEGVGELLPLTSLASLTSFACHWQLDAAGDEGEAPLDDEGTEDNPTGWVALTTKQVRNAVTLNATQCPASWRTVYCSMCGTCNPPA